MAPFLFWVSFILSSYSIMMFVLRSFMQSDPSLLYSAQVGYHFFAACTSGMHILNYSFVDCMYFCHGFFISMHIAKCFHLNFMASKLEIYNPNRYLGSEMKVHPGLIKFTQVLGASYVISIFVMLAIRECSKGPLCVTTLAPARLSFFMFVTIIAAEGIICYEFLRCRRVLREKIGYTSYWLANEVEQQIMIYNSTSLLTIFANFVCFIPAVFFYRLPSHTIEERRSLHNLLFAIYAANSIFTTTMVIICLPWRSYSWYHIIVHHNKEYTENKDTEHDEEISSTSWSSCDTCDDIPLGADYKGYQLSKMSLLRNSGHMEVTSIQIQDTLGQTLVLRKIQENRIPDGTKKNMWGPSDSDSATEPPSSTCSEVMLVLEDSPKKNRCTYRIVPIDSENDGKEPSLQI